MKSGDWQKRATALMDGDRVIMCRYSVQYAAHASLLSSFSDHMAALEATTLHPAVQTERYKRLSDFLGAQRAKEWAESCRRSHSHFAQKVRAQSKLRAGLQALHFHTLVVVTWPGLHRFLSQVSELEALFEALKLDVDALFMQARKWGHANGHLPWRVGESAQPACTSLRLILPVPHSCHPVCSSLTCFLPSAAQAPSVDLEGLGRELQGGQSVQEELESIVQVSQSGCDHGCGHVFLLTRTHTHSDVAPPPPLYGRLSVFETFLSALLQLGYCSTGISGVEGGGGAGQA
jgi:hypothetical protein